MRFLYATCCFFLFSSCGTAQNSASEIAESYDNPAPRRIEECGVESYESSARPECGIAHYLQTRSGYCPVELYFEKSSMACPGSVVGRSYSRRSPCRPGEEVDREVFDGERRPSVTYYCKEPDQPTRCRLPQFGIELYQNCENPAHGVASYNTCADNSRPIFRTCSALTRSEIENYLISVESQVGSIGPMVILHQSSIFKTTYSEAALACLIKKHEPDPFAVDVVNDLKTQFPIFMGKAYSPTLAVDCEKAIAEASAVQNCEQTPNAPACKAKAALASTVDWLRAHAERTVRFQSEPAIQMRPDLGERLRRLNTEIKTFLK